MRAPSPLAAALYEVAKPDRFAWRCSDARCGRPVPWGELFCPDAPCEQRVKDEIDAALAGLVEEDAP